jgi:DNA-binding CsgD family transcriptional regulator
MKLLEIENGTTIAGLTVRHENKIADGDVKEIGCENHRGLRVQATNQMMQRKNSALRARSSENTRGLVMNAKTGNEVVETTVTILTAMENRVLTLVTLAKTNKEIARGLGISPGTVKRHVENLLRKLKLKNRVDAAVYGLVAKGCPARDRSACALEAWRRRPSADENGPFGT